MLPLWASGISVVESIFPCHSHFWPPPPLKVGFWQLTYNWFLLLPPQFYSPTSCYKLLLKALAVYFKSHLTQNIHLEVVMPLPQMRGGCRPCVAWMSAEVCVQLGDPSGSPLLGERKRSSVRYGTCGIFVGSPKGCEVWGIFFSFALCAYAEHSSASCHFFMRPWFSNLGKLAVDS